MMLAYPLQRQRHATAARERLLSRLEEFLYRLLIVPLVAFLPAPLAYGIACLRGDWCCRLNASLRARIIDNLAAVLGDQLSAAERRQVARDYFAAFLRGGGRDAPGREGARAGPSDRDTGPGTYRGGAGCREGG